jgi:methyl-accepting chemotaxis protein
MKMNLPVTQAEVELKESQSIVSKTDLKGQITYINRDFVEISGFSEAELLGQSHNIVRHPDMPPEAFEDLWRTLKAGRPWTGLVKNRCKNGDYYWVQANATPIRESGQVVGYLSVRSKPGREQVQAADQAYRLFREGKARGLEIREGRVVKAIPAWMRAAAGLSVKGRLVSLVSVVAVLIAVGTAFGVAGMMRGLSAVDALYQARLLPMGALASFDDSLMAAAGELRVVAARAGAGAGVRPQELEGGLAKAEAGFVEAGTAIDELYKRDWLAEDKAMLGKLRESLAILLANGVKPAAEQLRAGRLEEFRNTFGKNVESRLDALEEAADVLKGRQLKLGQEEYAAAKHQIDQVILLGGMGGLVGLLVVGFMGWRIQRAIAPPLAQAREIFGHLSEGNFRNRIVVERHDEVGEILDGLQSLQIRLGFDIAEQRRVANENLRVRQALDSVSTNVRIADNEGRVLYINNALQNTLRRYEGEIRKKIPAFAADKFIGSSIAVFYDDPQAALNRLASLRETVRSEIVIGGRLYALITSPIVTSDGVHLGSVGEWRDRTDEAAVEQEVTALVNAAAAGDFTRHLPTEGKEGFFLQLAEGMNSVMENASSGLADVARVLNAVSRGDLTEQISADYAGTFGQLKDDTNATVARLREVVGQIKEATEAIDVASKEIAAGNTDLSSRTEEQASSLEETASSMEQLNATVRQNADNARAANELARSSNVVAEAGGHKMQDVVATMSAIQESARKIADIIGVIDSIAFQTNILALNAAVEAARAGEQGRGFAVVASEVRNLAQRSAQAAKEIKGLIADSVDKVEAGGSLVADAGQTMNEMVANFQRLAALVTDIAAASREQSAGIEQVTQAVGQMDEVTQQNAALVEQAAAAAESLEEQARSLVGTVAMFQLGTEPRPVASAMAKMDVAAPVARRPAAKVAALPVRATARAGGGSKAVPKVKRGAPAASIDDWEEF